jgi:hypothetical protein
MSGTLEPLDFAAHHWADGIAIIALLLAFAHGRNLSKAQSRLDKVTEDLKKVLETLPTQPLYEFPHYLHRIAQLVSDAKRSIIVCSDYPAYGSFSNPVAYLKYGNSLRTKCLENHVTVAIYCLNTENRRKSTIEEFKEEDWVAYKRENEKLIRDYLTIHSHDLSEEALRYDDLTYEAFLSLIINEDTNSLASEFGGASVKELKEKPPVYFWYIDDAMVFVIPSGPRLTENGFYTRDPHLINGVLDLAQRYTNHPFTRAGVTHELTKKAPRRHTERRGRA